MFYSDTSNLAFQLLAQNSRMLKKTTGQKNLNANFIRMKAIFSIVVVVKSISNDNSKKILAEKLLSMDPKAVFDLYKLVGFYLEWMANYPTNLPIMRFIKTSIDEIHNQISSNPLKEQNSSESAANIKKLMDVGTLLPEEAYRHEFVSMNDYARKNDKIVSAAIDDEMVVIEMKGFLKEQLRWLESSSCR